LLRRFSCRIQVERIRSFGLRLSPWQWAFLPLRRFARFDGRAPRPEFWWFHLSTILLWIAAILIDETIFPNGIFGEQFGPVSLVLTAAIVLPWLAVLVRRLHDSGKSGWYALLIFLPYVGILVLIWMASRPGTPDSNEFGDDPYGRALKAELVEPTVRAPSRF